ncbi:hypothetical protein B0H67DRAFT_649996 [Lasiosphaeris hirsuta]|uniref:Uncharacterized protein n=1 Tax=Lasiosphaeris hirsuta TaxID=260670 RepID=A0AA39ZY23_9PEZI|nr:hypothetical protein B0H67DRAFT_649996 [Lasiosphaeris hirsuta]
MSSSAFVNQGPAMEQDSEAYPQCIQILAELRDRQLARLHSELRCGRLGAQESLKLHGIDELTHKFKTGTTNTAQLMRQIKAAAQPGDGYHLTLSPRKTYGHGHGFGACGRQDMTGELTMRDIALGASIVDYAEKYLAARSIQPLECPDQVIWRGLSPGLRALIQEPAPDGPSFYSLWFKAVRSAEFVDAQKQALVALQLDAVDKSSSKSESRSFSSWLSWLCGMGETETESHNVPLQPRKPEITGTNASPTPRGDLDTDSPPTRDPESSLETEDAFIQRMKSKLGDVDGLDSVIATASVAAARRRAY